MTAEEAWTYLKIGRTKFYEDARSGAIPHVRFGRKIIVYKSALHERLRDEAGRKKVSDI